MKKLLLVLALLMIVVLETSFLPYLPLFGVTPCLGLIVLLCLTAVSIKRAAPFLLWLTLGVGLTADLLSVGWFGWYSLAFLAAVGGQLLLTYRLSRSFWTWLVWALLVFSVLGAVEYGWGVWYRLIPFALVNTGVLLITYPLVRLVADRVFKERSLQLSFEDWRHPTSLKLRRASGKHPIKGASRLSNGASG